MPGLPKSLGQGNDGIGDVDSGRQERGLEATPSSGFVAMRNGTQTSVSEKRSYINLHGLLSMGLKEG